ncbi:MAG: bL17 family ribosomal protein [Flavobacteriaceae bacterium]|nr:bL17 family ribosomal protein [Flavobacteriaceae bacterium]
MASKLLRSKKAVTELFNEVSTKVGDRPGGYTRGIKLGHRLGDHAEMAMIEFTDYNEIYKLDKSSKSSKRTIRSKKSPKSKDSVKPISQESSEPKDSKKSDVENSQLVSENDNTLENLKS